MIIENKAKIASRVCNVELSVLASRFLSPVRIKSVTKNGELTVCSMNKLKLHDVSSQYGTNSISASLTPHCTVLVLISLCLSDE